MPRRCAAFQAMAEATAVAGALGGGLLGQVLGRTGRSFIAAAGLALAPAIGGFTPLRRVRKVSET